MFLTSYEFSEPTKCSQVVQCTIPYSKDYDASWIEKSGDIILIISCTDGIVVILREPQQKTPLHFKLPPRDTK